MTKQEAIFFLELKKVELTTPILPHEVSKWLRVVRDYFRILFGESSEMYKSVSKYEWPSPKEFNYHESLGVKRVTMGWIFEDAIDLINSGIVDSKLNELSNNSFPVRSNLAVSETPYIAISRIAELKAITSKRYDPKRLIQLCEEVNLCYTNDCYIATIILTRTILDHVAIVFGKKSFAEVASNYGSKSFKEAMLHLENSSRKIADSNLHSSMRKEDTLLTGTQVNFSQNIDMLLGELIILLKSENLNQNLEKTPNPSTKKEISQPKVIEHNKEPTSDDIAKEIIKKVEFAEKKDKILKSKETIKRADISVDIIIDTIKFKVNNLRNLNIGFVRENHSSNPNKYILQSKRHSISVEWNKNVTYSEKTGVCLSNNSKLIVNFNDGHILDDTPLKSIL